MESSSSEIPKPSQKADLSISKGADKNLSRPDNSLKNSSDGIDKKPIPTEKGDGNPPNAPSSGETQNFPLDSPRPFPPSRSHSDPPQSASSPKRIWGPPGSAGQKPFRGPTLRSVLIGNKGATNSKPSFTAPRTLRASPGCFVPTANFIRGSQVRMRNFSQPLVLTKLHTSNFDHSFSGSASTFPSLSSAVSNNKMLNRNALIHSANYPQYQQKSTIYSPNNYYVAPNRGVYRSNFNETSPNGLSWNSPVYYPSPNQRNYYYGGRYVSKTSRHSVNRKPTRKQNRSKRPKVAKAKRPPRERKKRKIEQPKEHKDPNLYDTNALEEFVPFCKCEKQTDETDQTSPNLVTPNDQIDEKTADSPKQTPKALCKTCHLPPRPSASQDSPREWPVGHVSTRQSQNSEWHFTQKLSVFPANESYRVGDRPGLFDQTPDRPGDENRWTLVSTTDLRSLLAADAHKLISAQWDEAIVGGLEPLIERRLSRKAAGYSSLLNPSGEAMAAAHWNFWEVNTEILCLCIKFLVCRMRNARRVSMRRKRCGSLLAAHLVDLALSRRRVQWVLVCSEGGYPEHFWQSLGFARIPRRERARFSVVSEAELNPFRDTVLMRLTRAELLARGGPSATAAAFARWREKHKRARRRLRFVARGETLLEAELPLF